MQNLTQMATNFGASLVAKVPYFGIYLISQDLKAPLVCEHLGFFLSSVSIVMCTVSEGF